MNVMYVFGAIVLLIGPASGGEPAQVPAMAGEGSAPKAAAPPAATTAAIQAAAAVPETPVTNILNQSVGSPLSTGAASPATPVPGP